MMTITPETINPKELEKSKPVNNLENIGQAPTIATETSNKITEVVEQTSAQNTKTSKTIPEKRSSGDTYAKITTIVNYLIELENKKSSETKTNKSSLSDKVQELPRLIKKSSQTTIKAVYEDVIDPSINIARFIIAKIIQLYRDLNNPEYRAEKKIAIQAKIKKYSEKLAETYKSVNDKRKVLQAQAGENWQNNWKKLATNKNAVNVQNWFSTQVSKLIDKTTAISQTVKESRLSAKITSQKNDILNNSPVYKFFSENPTGQQIINIISAPVRWIKKLPAIRRQYFPTAKEIKNNVTIGDKIKKPFKPLIEKIKEKASNLLKNIIEETRKREDGNNEIEKAIKF